MKHSVSNVRGGYSCDNHHTYLARASLAHSLPRNPLATTNRIANEFTIDIAIVLVVDVILEKPTWTAIN
jgi:hypothetical protein